MVPFWEKKGGVSDLNHTSLSPRGPSFNHWVIVSLKEISLVCSQVREEEGRYIPKGAINMVAMSINVREAQLAYCILCSAEGD